MKIAIALMVATGLMFAQAPAAAPVAAPVKAAKVKKAKAVAAVITAAPVDVNVTWPVAISVVNVPALGTLLPIGGGEAKELEVSGTLT